MAWYMGNPLSQTLFTSFYLDRMLWPQPRTLEDAKFDRDKRAAQENGLIHVLLRAYCVGLIKTCDLAHRTIGAEQYYEVSCYILQSHEQSLPFHYCMQSTDL